MYKLCESPDLSHLYQDLFTFSLRADRRSRKVMFHTGFYTKFSGNSYSNQKLAYWVSTNPLWSGLKNLVG